MKANNHEEQTAAMMAALFGRVDILNLLVEQNADLQIQGASGNTAASLARQQGNLPGRRVSCASGGGSNVHAQVSAEMVLRGSPCRLDALVPIRMVR